MDFAELASAVFGMGNAWTTHLQDQFKTLPPPKFSWNHLKLHPQVNNTVPHLLRHAQALAGRDLTTAERVSLVQATMTYHQGPAAGGVGGVLFCAATAGLVLPRPSSRVPRFLNPHAYRSFFLRTACRAVEVGIWLSVGGALGPSLFPSSASRTILAGYLMRAPAMLEWNRDCWRKWADDNGAVVPWDLHRVVVPFTFGHTNTADAAKYATLHTSKSLDWYAKRFADFRQQSQWESDRSSEEQAPSGAIEKAHSEFARNSG